MSANELLIWMSARGQGSWQQFRAAVEELHLNDATQDEQPETEDDNRDASALPRYQQLRLNLERLGHAEFFAGARSNGWRVTPPTLAAAESRNGWRGALAGARTPKVLQRLRDATSQENLEVIALADCPDQIRIVGSNRTTLASVAYRAGLLFQDNAPNAILMSLPPVDHPSVRKESELPLGSDWAVERFSTSAGKWRAAARQDALSTSAGLFRFSLQYRRMLLFCSKGRAFEISAQVAKYLLLSKKRRRIIRYDPDSHALSIPGTYRPPFLIERALILCAAAPPSYESGLLHYTDVSRSVAELASALLRQELQ